MKTRIKSELKSIAVLISAGITYYFIITAFGMAVPCIFNQATGLLCPACGITRMIIAVARLDFYDAYCYNRALFITLPIVGFVFVFGEIKYIKTGIRKPGKASSIILWIEIVILILFGIVRNIY